MSEVVTQRFPATLTDVEILVLEHELGLVGHERSCPECAGVPVPSRPRVATASVSRSGLLWQWEVSYDAPQAPGDRGAPRIPTCIRGASLLRRAAVRAARKRLTR